MRSSHVFLATSALIHALLLCIPLAAPVAPQKMVPTNPLIAVELLFPEPENLKIHPDIKADLSTLPRQALKKKPANKPDAHTEPLVKNQSPAQPREATVSLDRLSEDDAQYRTYVGHLRSKIRSVWVYPPEASDKGLNGTVTVRFSIARTGSLQGLTLIKNSPHQLLNNEALRTIKAAAPFLPLPPEFNIDTLNVTASFEYEFSDH